MVRTKENRGRNYWNPFLAFSRNWLHQGLSYMDTGERLFRLVTEFSVTAVLWLLLLPFYKNVIEIIIAFTLIGVIVHTLNWLFNSQLWCFLIHTCPRLKNPGPNATCRYYNKMANRLRKKRSIAGVAIYGSVSRGQWHDRSDIDLRFIRKAGFGNCVATVFWASCERFYAVLNKQPIDLYVADDLSWLKTHMRNDEKPVFLLKQGQLLENGFPGNPPVELTQEILSRRYG